MNHPKLENELLPCLGEVISFARRLCSNGHDSNDLVQETMLKACVSVDSYREGTNGRAWLFQICKNTQINRVRRGKREKPFSSFPNQEDGTEQSMADFHQTVLDTEALGDEVSSALNSIPADCKTAVLLRDIEGFSYAEIAKLQRVPIGTIRSRLHRGRKILALKLRDYAIKKGYDRIVRGGRREFIAVSGRVRASS